VLSKAGFKTSFSWNSNWLSLSSRENDVKLFHSLSMAAAIRLMLCSSRFAASISKAVYKAAKKQIEATYQADKETCDAI
jgi:hypothetical protein